MKEKKIKIIKVGDKIPKPEGIASPSITDTMKRKLLSMNKETRKAYIEILADSLIDMAIKGSISAHGMILDRVDGPLVKSLDIRTQQVPHQMEPEQKARLDSLLYPAPIQVISVDITTKKINE